jgi:hypothetical protein
LSFQLRFAVLSLPKVLAQVKQLKLLATILIARHVYQLFAEGVKPLVKCKVV